MTVKLHQLILSVFLSVVFGTLLHAHDQAQPVLPPKVEVAKPAIPKLSEIVKQMMGFYTKGLANRDETKVVMFDRALTAEFKEYDEDDSDSLAKDELLGHALDFLLTIWVQQTKLKKSVGVP